MHVLLSQQQEDKHPSLPIDAVLINQEKLQNVSDCVSHLCQKSLNLYYANTLSFPFHLHTFSSFLKDIHKSSHSMGHLFWFQDD